MFWFLFLVPVLAQLHRRSTGAPVQMLLSPNEDGYYDFTDIKVGDNDVDLKLDLIQPELWVMDGLVFLPCEDLDEWYDDHTSLYEDYTAELPTTISLFHTKWPGDICYASGAYYTTEVPYTTGEAVATSEPSPHNDGIYNGESYDIQYPDTIVANGVLETNDVMLYCDGEYIDVGNFTFVLVNETNVYSGGLGLAGNPAGLGFLDSLKNLGFIEGAGYSMVFANDSTGNATYGMLFPGSVNEHHFKGDLVAYDMLSYEGLYDSWNNSVRLPIVQLLDVVLQAESGKTISISSDDNVLPVVLDLRMYYTFLPLTYLVNLAVQTDAVYNSKIQRWIVKCSSIANADATIEFKFGNLTVSAPLNKFMTRAYYDGDYLKFADGSEACYLLFLPNTLLGYDSLGLPFLQEVFLAVDNEGAKVAMANRNLELVFGPGVSTTLSLGVGRAPSLALDVAADPSTTRTAGSVLAGELSTGTVELITSGHIPFATSYTYTLDVTFTFNTTVSDKASIPAQYSGGSIRSGEVIVGYSTDAYALDASAASATKSKSGGSRGVGGDRKVSLAYVGVAAVVVGAVCVM